MKQLHFLFFFLFFTGISAAKTLPVQLIALLSLKSSLVDPLDTLHSWKPSRNPIWCNWSGIKCDQHDHIISIDISNRNLSGTIASNIRHLGHLRYLNLSTNAFQGPLPPHVFELRSLISLDISHNAFSSGFPSGISKLKWLSYLDAYNNDFNGSLPQDITQLQLLEHLHLGGSYFSGEIPGSYCSFPRLKFLDLAGNLLTGALPAEIGLLKQLQRIEIGYNEFTGELPTQLSQLSNLTYLDISSANLSGEIPIALGNLSKLETLLLFKNRFRGSIPPSLSQLASLKVLDLSFNQLNGIIPSEVSLLKELNTLNLMTNKLTGDIPEGVAGLPNLEFLSLWNNSLTGVLPPKLGSNGKLQKLDVSSNALSGPIPPHVCDGNRLVKLLLFSNQFSGHLPFSLGSRCTALERFRVQNNFLNGSLPEGFGLSHNITFMDVSNNNFSGSLPRDLSNAPKLEYLNISNNFFQKELPDNVWSSPSLQIFSASHSSLIGKLPDFNGCESLYKIELEGNAFTGNIPWDIGHCHKLISMNLRQNLLTGIIPWEISALPSITDVDLSHNLLTGTIPANFDNSSTLENFNVSYNRLTGPVPSSGNILSIFHPSSFIGNKGLCGSILGNPCRASDLSPRDVDVQAKQQSRSAGAILWILAAAFGLVLFTLIALIRCYHARYHRGFASGNRDIGQWKLTAFQRLNFRADDVLYSMSVTDKILGMGSMGTVYKAEMPGGETIAVKKLWGKQKEMIRQRKGVLAEVEVLGSVRHRNIVRLLGCCSNNESTMLLYEYMPNGNLDDLLHGNHNKGDNSVADWLTRYKIAMGVAQGICYLHHDCDPVIVHRDLKPSNILLDAQMEARVADFGVAKLIQRDESMSVIAGSYGYIAPEYAYTLQVDEKSDIYSYGVVLMEILCGRRSVDAEFGDGSSIVDWVKTKIKTKEGLRDVLDKNAGALCAPVREEMMLLLRVALLCTSRNPADRPPMRDVVSMLLEAKPKRKVPARGDFGGCNKHVVDFDDQDSAAEC
ncbi:hypothetical protein ACET3Z_014856 [Daucus carota]